MAISESAAAAAATAAATAAAAPNPAAAAPTAPNPAAAAPTAFKPVAAEEEEYEEVEEEVEETESESEDDASDAAAAGGGDDDTVISREAIRELLEPFGKDQLIDLLKTAALADPTLLRRISGTPAPVDPALRKLFVHGLGYDATTDDLKAAFAHFGDIEDCRAVQDRNTGRCKGFGFVLFRSLSAAKKALKEPQKKIGSRMTSCQLASLGPPAQTGQAAPASAVGVQYNHQIGPSGFGVSQGMAPPSQYGVGMGLGGGTGVTSASPGVIGRYSTPSSLPDLAAYQSDPYASLRSQSGIGSLGSGLPPYYGRY